MRRFGTMRFLHLALAASLMLLAFALAPTASASCSSTTVGGAPVYATVQYGDSPSCVHAGVYRCVLRIDPDTWDPYWACSRVVGV